MKKYKAEFIDKACRLAEEARQRDLEEENPFPGVLPANLPNEFGDVKSTYHAIEYNCKHYVYKVIELAEKLAKEKGESPYYE